MIMNISTRYSARIVSAVALFILAGMVVAGYSPAATPAFPAKGKVLTIIVPFSPGGSTAAFVMRDPDTVTLRRVSQFFAAGFPSSVER
jgi:hypothetical protein